MQTGYPTPATEATQRGINELHDRGVNIKSLMEPDIDTTTPMGRALFGIVAVFAQLRLDTIKDNTRRGLKHACAQGRLGGRPSVMSTKGVAAAVQSETPEPVSARSPGRSALAFIGHSSARPVRPSR
jgi:DNA invertase Pin-like site-specific DNA recombinase